jgi:transposase
MKQLQYNMLFRWLVNLSMDDAVWVPTVFTKNRERLTEHDAIIAFFNNG